MPSKNYEILWEIPDFVKVIEVADGFKSNYTYMSGFKAVIEDAGYSPAGIPVGWSFQLCKQDKNPVSVMVKREISNDQFLQRNLHDEVCITLKISMFDGEEFAPLVGPQTFGMIPKDLRILDLAINGDYIAHLPPNGQLTLQIQLEQFGSSSSEMISETNIPNIPKYDGVSRCLEDFSNLFISGVHSDFCIKLETGTTFKVHKAILAARSSVFDRMLQSGMQECANGELIVTDIGSQAMKVVLQFLYSGKIDESSVSIANVAEVAYAADKYDLVHIKKTVDNLLPSFCVVENAKELLKICQLFKFEAAERRIRTFVEQNVWEILQIDP